MKIEESYEDLKKNCDKKFVVRLLDMKNRYKNFNVRGNPIIYSVYIRRLGSFEVALTILEPGDINREFYMTRGHKHRKLRKELYFFISGNGKLLIQGNSLRVLNVKKGKLYFVPERAGHRVINVGKEKLKFLSFYSKDAGHDYNFKFKKRFFK